MGPVELMVGFGVVVAIAMGLYWYFNEHNRTARALREVPVARVAMAKEGERVRICGQLRYEGTPLVAPISQRSCAAWWIHIEEKRSSGKSSHWHTLVEERDATRFRVEDGSGAALVMVVDLPKIAIAKDVHLTSGTFNDPAPHLIELLAARGYSTEGWFGFNKALRYEEGVLEEGEMVSVLGMARREPDPDPGEAGYRERKMRLVLEAPDDGPLLISDDPSTIA